MLLELTVKKCFSTLFYKEIQKTVVDMHQISADSLPLCILSSAEHETKNVQSF